MASKYRKSYAILDSLLKHIDDQAHERGPVSNVASFHSQTRIHEAHHNDHSLHAELTRTPSNSHKVPHHHLNTFENQRSI